MGKREEKRKIKVYVLNKIKAKKEVLFGAFSEKLTKADKNQAWKDVGTYANSLGVVAAGKDTNYLRDVWWPNIRKTTVEKMDNARRTGSAGGADKKMDEVDNVVLDIIGKKSPVVGGLGVSKSMERHAAINGQICDAPEDNELHVPIQENTTSGPKLSPQRLQKNTYSLKNLSWRQPKMKKFTEPSSLNMEKQRLQIDLLNINIYKTKLEARQLEISMGFPKSSFTFGIPDQNISNGNVNCNNVIDVSEERSRSLNASIDDTELIDFDDAHYLSNESEL